MATKTGSSDPEGNPRLRSAIDKALAANMARDVINRAIQRGSGEGTSAGYQEILYEGYGPGGVAILIECSTDNRNRTVSEVRHALSKYGGNLGTEGSVTYLFDRVGSIQFAADKDEEKIMDLVIEAGAEDIDVMDDGTIMVTTPVDSFYQVVTIVNEAGFEYEEAAIEQRATSSMEVNGDIAERIINLVNAIEELNDVQDVYTNAAMAGS